MIECSICGKPIENPKRAWAEFETFVRISDDQEAAGARRYTGRYAHDDCAPGAYLTDRERDLAQRYRGLRGEET